MDTSSTVVPAAGVAIFDAQARLLLGRHCHDGRWATFGGRVEEGESTRGAAVREVEEEIGVLLTERLHKLGVFGGSSLYTVDYPDWGPTTYEVTMYATIVRQPLKTVPHIAEIAEVRWVGISELDSIELAPDMREIIPAACTWHSIVALRPIDQLPDC